MSRIQLTGTLVIVLVCTVALVYVKVPERLLAPEFRTTVEAQNIDNHDQLNEHDGDDGHIEQDRRV